MDASVFNLFRAQYKVESAFATNPDFSGGTTDVPLLAIPDRAPMKRLRFEDETVRQQMGALAGIMGMPGPTTYGGQGQHEFTTTHYMVGYASAIPAVAPTAHWLATLLQSAFGGLYTPTMTPAAIAAGGGASAINIVNGELTNTSPGCLYAFLMNAGATAFEARFGKQINDSADPDVLTLYHADFALSAIPTAAWKVYAGITAYHIDATAGGTLAWQWSGHSAADKRVSLGCHATGCTITLETGQLPKIEIRWKAAMTDSSGTSAIAAQTISTPKPTAYGDGYCKITDGTTALALRVAKVVLDYSFDLIGEPDPNATTGADISGWTKSPNALAKVTFEPLFADQWETWYEGQTSLYFETSWGPQPGKMIGLRLPNGVVNNDYNPAMDGGGLSRNAVTIESMPYTGDTDNDAAITGNGYPIDKMVAVSFA